MTRLRNGREREVERAPRGPGQARVEARRSIFLARLEPVVDESLWRERVEAWRTAHPGARHVAWALRLAGGTERASDDGEPAGTAGLPCLRALQAAGLVDAGVAVARHFGGTLLGRGGLIRAYGDAARQAVGAALAEHGAEERQPRDAVGIIVPYPDWPAVERWLQSDPALALERVDYGREVRAAVSLPSVEGGRSRFKSRLFDVTSGRARLEPRGEPGGSGRSGSSCR